MLREEDQLVNKKKVYILLGLIALIMVVVEVLFAHPHHHMLWNTVPGFDLIIGFAGAWFLIILAKIVMAKLIQRPENYYEGSKEKGGAHHD